MSVTLKDFYPINTWTPEYTGPNWSDKPTVPKFLIDKATGRRYWNESKGIVGFKCFLLTPGTPVVHSIASVLNVDYRIIKLVTFSHFYNAKTTEEGVKEAGKDLLRIVLTPISLVGLQLAAIYGLVRPYDGRKLYATIERATYGNYILGPCFQPNPTRHAFGGNAQMQNAF